MSKTQQIIAAIETERASGLNASEAESLRWALWRVWDDLGEQLADAARPGIVTSTEWADACATIGINRGTALNRHSEARRNWESCYGDR